MRVERPPRVDGVLDENHYGTVPPMSGFIQVEPSPGAAATEQTDVWVSSDRDAVYVAARLWDSEVDRLVATEMRRDSTTMWQGNDLVTFIFDAFYDRRNLDLKPYATSSLTTNHTSSPGVSNRLYGDGGLDVKYAVTGGMAADLTINTDFAQVEADEQQINLTRFSLFFPEKRDFFLENQGMFSFGGVQLASFGSDQSAPILFYSRRIGLNQGREVPLDVGGRLTGRAGRYSIAVLGTKTGAEGPDTPSAAPATGFSVIRVKRDILGSSSVGVIATGRSVALAGAGGNLAYGLDGTFAFFDNLTINACWARTATDGRTGDETSYRGQPDYNGDTYGVQLDRVVIGDDFNPEVGFLRRADMRRSFAQFRYGPRPRSMPAVRRFRYQAGLTSIENGAGVLETREVDGEFGIEFQSGDQVSAAFSDVHEFLPAPFPISASQVTLPVGGHDFRYGRLALSLGRQRRMAASLSVERGTFYNGHRTTVSASQGRMSLTPALSVEPTYSMNDVDLVQGAFTTHLAGSRLTCTATTRLLVSALVQYNSGINAVPTNARLRWEYQPGSEIFVVYDEERNTPSRSFPSLAARSLIVKINRLFRL